jgi:hypothetical protein
MTISGVFSFCLFYASPFGGSADSLSDLSNSEFIKFPCAHRETSLYERGIRPSQPRKQAKSFVIESGVLLGFLDWRERSVIGERPDDPMA